MVDVVAIAVRIGRCASLVGLGYGLGFCLGRESERGRIYRRLRTVNAVEYVTVINNGGG